MNKEGMSRRDFIRLSGSASAYLLASNVITPSCTSKTKHPNIVFILADDLGYGDLGCLNPESKIPTPNLDKLARQGISFTDAHSSSSLCSPTRYGIMTGRYSWRSNRQGGALWSFDPPLIEDDRLTLPQYLRNNGYHTACIGKMAPGYELARQKW